VAVGAVGDVVVVVEVVPGVVPGVVVAVVVVAVVAGAPAPAVDIDVVEPPVELPHAASSTTKGSRTRRFMGTECWARLETRATIRTNMDRSEELRQTPGRGRTGLLGAVERWLPFWEPQLVVACAIALQLALSEQVSVGPSWLLPTLEGVLLIGLVIVSPHPNVRHSRVRRHVAIAMIGFVSAANIVSLVLLCHHLLAGGKQNGHALILSGIVLWCTNVLLFGLWYWEVDRGGPAARASSEQDWPDLLFPQMSDPKWAPPDWRPRLIDYLYVSLTNATAFSPTDTMPLTPTAKWMMSAQSIASLITVGLVVARAVNILS
jgi:uncharacterized membrane protein